MRFSFATLAVLAIIGSTNFPPASGAARVQNSYRGSQPDTRTTTTSVGKEELSSRFLRKTTAEEGSTKDLDADKSLRSLPMSMPGFPGRKTMGNDEGQTDHPLFMSMPIDPFGRRMKKNKKRSNTNVGTEKEVFLRSLFRSNRNSNRHKRKMRSQQREEESSPRALQMSMPFRKMKDNEEGEESLRALQMSMPSRKMKMNDMDTHRGRKMKTKENMKQEVGSSRSLQMSMPDRKMRMKKPLKTEDPSFRSLQMSVPFRRMKTNLNVGNEDSSRHLQMSVPFRKMMKTSSLDIGNEKSSHSLVLEQGGRALETFGKEEQQKSENLTMPQDHLRSMRKTLTRKEKMKLADSSDVKGNKL